MNGDPEDRLGMTEEQWAWFQEYTHGFGEQDENGIDLPQVRDSLRRTPTERLHALHAIQPLLRELRRAGIAAGTIPSPKRFPQFWSERVLPEEPILDCERLFRAFAESGLDYVVVGGVALCVHGVTLSTEGLDVVIDDKRKSFRAFMLALRQLEFHPKWPVPALEDKPFAQQIRQLAHVPMQAMTGAGPVKLLMGRAAGAGTYEELAAGAIKVRLFGIDVRVASLDQVEAMKRAVGRSVDDLHLAHLAAVRRVGAEPEFAAATCASF